MKKTAIILAAGKGTRMKSELPKVMHTVAGRPMIEHLVNKLEQMKVDEIIVIVGHKKELIQDYLGERVTCIEQKEQLGTGHAILQAKEHLKNVDGQTLILTGDTPLLSIETLEGMFIKNEKKDGVVLTTHMQEPFGYGRIVRNIYDIISSIVEEKDADYNQKQITEVNSGIFCFDNQSLFSLINKLDNNNNQNEYYLTDMVQIFNQNKKSFDSFTISNADEAMGINDKVALAKAEKIMRSSIIKNHLLNGVSIIDPDNVYIDDTVIIDNNAVIHPNVSLKGNTEIGPFSEIGMNTEIKDSKIHSHVSIKQSVVYDSEIKDRATIGPFANIRPNSNIGEDCRIGNFVETKNSTFGNGSKTSHLSYIGDAEIGDKVNIGCGSITVNYDGFKKYKTIIEDGAFVGCNVNLIAPVTVKKNSLVAAGSTITKEVPEDSLAVARSKQENKEGYAKRKREKN